MAESVGSERPQELAENFDFYVRFAKPLVLNLSSPNERVLAAAWVQKLSDVGSGDEKLRTDYLKLLLFVLQKGRLFGPFAHNPSTAPLDGLGMGLRDVAKCWLETEENVKKRRFILGFSSEYPPISAECSGDLKEYAAAQDIPNFGIHAYYAFSNEPITQWHNMEKGIFPKGALSAVKKSESLSALSVHTRKSRSKSKEKSFEAMIRSRSKSKTRSRSTSRSGIKGSAGDMTDQSLRKVSFQPEQEKVDTVEHKISSPLGSPMPTETRTPPTWGSNLISVSDPPPTEGVMSPSVDPKKLTRSESLESSGLNIHYRKIKKKGIFEESIFPLPPKDASPIFLESQPSYHDVSDMEVPPLKRDFTPTPQREEREIRSADLIRRRRVVHRPFDSGPRLRHAEWGLPVEDLTPREISYGDSAPSLPYLTPPRIYDEAPSLPYLTPPRIYDEAPSLPYLTPPRIYDEAPSLPYLTPPRIYDEAPSLPYLTPPLVQRIPPQPSPGEEMFFPLPPRDTTPIFFESPPSYQDVSDMEIPPMRRPFTPTPPREERQVRSADLLRRRKVVYRPYHSGPRLKQDRWGLPVKDMTPPIIYDEAPSLPYLTPPLGAAAQLDVPVDEFAQMEALAEVEAPQEVVQAPRAEAMEQMMKRIDEQYAQLVEPPPVVDQEQAELEEFKQMEQKLGVSPPKQKRRGIPVAQKRSAKAARSRIARRVSQQMQMLEREPAPDVAIKKVVEQEPPKVSPKAQDIVEEAMEELARVVQPEQTLEEMYEEQDRAFPHRRKDMERTPPVFSKFAKIREGPGRRLRYRPEDFGLPEDEQFIPGPEFMRDKIALSPRELDRDLRRVSPSREALLQEDVFDYALEDAFLESDEEEAFLSPSPKSKSFERAVKEAAASNLQQAVDDIPALGGVPATTPKKTPIPIRVGDEESFVTFEEEDIPPYESPQSSREVEEDARMLEMQRIYSPAEAGAAPELEFAWGVSEDWKSDYVSPPKPKPKSPSPQKAPPPEKVKQKKSKMPKKKEVKLTRREILAREKMAKEAAEKAKAEEKQKKIKEKKAAAAAAKKAQSKSAKEKTIEERIDEVDNQLKQLYATIVDEEQVSCHGMTPQGRPSPYFSPTTPPLFPSPPKVQPGVFDIAVSPEFDMDFQQDFLISPTNLPTSTPMVRPPREAAHSAEEFFDTEDETGFIRTPPGLEEVEFEALEVGTPPLQERLKHHQYTKGYLDKRRAARTPGPKTSPIAEDVVQPEAIPGPCQPVCGPSKPPQQQVQFRTSPELSMSERAFIANFKDPEQAKLVQKVMDIVKDVSDEGSPLFQPDDAFFPQPEADQAEIADAQPELLDDLDIPDTTPDQEFDFRDFQPELPIQDPEAAAALQRQAEELGVPVVGRPPSPALATIGSPVDSFELDEYMALKEAQEEAEKAGEVPPAVPDYMLKRKPNVFDYADTFEEDMVPEVDLLEDRADEFGDISPFGGRPGDVFDCAIECPIEVPQPELQQQEYAPSPVNVRAGLPKVSPGAPKGSVVISPDQGPIDELLFKSQILAADSPRYRDKFHVHPGKTRGRSVPVDRVSLPFIPPDVPEEGDVFFGPATRRERRRRHRELALQSPTHFQPARGDLAAALDRERELNAQKIHTPTRGPGPVERVPRRRLKPRKIDFSASAEWYDALPQQTQDMILEYGIEEPPPEALPEELMDSQAEIPFCAPCSAFDEPIAEDLPSPISPAQRFEMFPQLRLPTPRKEKTPPRPVSPWHGDIGAEPWPPREQPDYIAVAQPGEYAESPPAYPEVDLNVAQYMLDDLATAAPFLEGEDAYVPISPPPESPPQISPLQLRPSPEKAFGPARPSPGYQPRVRQLPPEPIMRAHQQYQALLRDESPVKRGPTPPKEVPPCISGEPCAGGVALPSPRGAARPESPHTPGHTPPGIDWPQQLPPDMFEDQPDLVEVSPLSPMAQMRMEVAKSEGKIPRRPVFVQTGGRRRSLPRKSGGPPLARIEQEIEEMPEVRVPTPPRVVTPPLPETPRICPAAVAGERRKMVKDFKPRRIDFGPSPPPPVLYGPPTWDEYLQQMVSDVEPAADYVEFQPPEVQRAPPPMDPDWLIAQSQVEEGQGQMAMIEDVGQIDQRAFLTPPKRSPSPVVKPRQPTPPKKPSPRQEREEVSPCFPCGTQEDLERTGVEFLPSPEDPFSLGEHVEYSPPQYEGTPPRTPQGTPPGPSPRTPQRAPEPSPKYPPRRPKKGSPLSPLSPFSPGFRSRLEEHEYTEHRGDSAHKYRRKAMYERKRRKSIPMGSLTEELQSPEVGLPQLPSPVPSRSPSPSPSPRYASPVAAPPRQDIFADISPQEDVYVDYQGVGLVRSPQEDIWDVAHGPEFFEDTDITQDYLSPGAALPQQIVEDAYVSPRYAPAVQVCPGVGPSPRLEPSPRPVPSPRLGPSPRPVPSPRLGPSPRPVPSPRLGPSPRPVPSPRLGPSPRPVPSPRLVPSPRPVPSPRRSPAPQIQLVCPGSPGPGPEFIQRVQQSKALARKEPREKKPRKMGTIFEGEGVYPDVIESYRKLTPPPVRPSPRRVVTPQQRLSPTPERITTTPFPRAKSPDWLEEFEMEDDGEGIADEGMAVCRAVCNPVLDTSPIPEDQPETTDFGWL